jgi:hypothetical protein
MRVDASQVRSGEHIGGLGGIAFRNTEMHEHASAEFLKRFDRKNLLLYVRHV